MKTQRNTRIIVACMLIGVIFGAGELTAQQSAGGAKEWWNNPNVQNQLGLTNSQIADVDKLNEELVFRADEANGIRQEAWKALKAAAADDPAGEAFASAASTYLQASEEAASLAIERLQGISGILGSEQFDMLAEVAPAALTPKVGGGAVALGGKRSVTSSQGSK